MEAWEELERSRTRRELVVFVDLVKASVPVNREMLWKVIAKMSSISCTKTRKSSAM